MCQYKVILQRQIYVTLPASYSTCLAVSIFCITGIQNAAVLPDPVLARANISFPSRASGIAFS